METATAVALVFTCLFGIVGPVVARRVAPAVGAWLLSVGGVLAALAGVAVLTMLGLTVVGQYPELAEYGHWSIVALRRNDPVARPVAVVALVIVLVLALRAARTAVRRARALRASYRTCTHLRGTGGMVVLPDATADAYALPGRPGRVVVTRGMLRLLDAQERRALLAHERSHLRHHHHRHVTATTVAAALNPLLGRLPAATAYVIERWADEDAAAEVPRAAVASALAAAAASAPSRSRPRVGLAAATVAVIARVNALREGPQRPRPVLLAAAVLTVVVALSAAVVATEKTAALFDSAHTSTSTSTSTSAPTGHR